MVELLSVIRNLWLVSKPDEFLLHPQESHKNVSALDKDKDCVYVQMYEYMYLLGKVFTIVQFMPNKAVLYTAILGHNYLSSL